ILGDEMAKRVRDLSLKIYSRGRDHAAQHGIIVADTKFEFGTVDGKLLLIDECLTPDSSRFWPADQYVVGQSPPSFDKQFVHDFPFATARAYRKRRDQILVHAVAAVRTDGDTVPIIARRIIR